MQIAKFILMILVLGFTCCQVKAQNEPPPTTTDTSWGMPLSFFDYPEIVEMRHRKSSSRDLNTHNILPHVWASSTALRIEGTYSINNLRLTIQDADENELWSTFICIRKREVLIVQIGYTLSVASYTLTCTIGSDTYLAPFDL